MRALSKIMKDGTDQDHDLQFWWNILLVTINVSKNDSRELTAGRQMYLLHSWFQRSGKWGTLGVTKSDINGDIETSVVI